MTGDQHAGENLTKLLKKRSTQLGAPIQMCDALSRNTSKEFETILSNCLVHYPEYMSMWSSTERHLNSHPSLFAGDRGDLHLAPQIPQPLSNTE